MLPSFVEARDDSDSDDDNDAPRLKKPRNLKAVAERLKLLDAEIECIRSVKFLDDALSYDVPRPAYCFENASTFFKKAPEEIMSEIFMACLPRWAEHVDYFHQGFDPNTMDRTRAPWVLTQVCSEWRDIALSFPRLWSRIVIRPDLAHSVLKIKTILLSLETSLLRSANTPLFVWLQANERTHTMERFKKPWTAILDALMRHSERWQDAIFALVPVQIRQLAGITGRVPKLRRLRLHILQSDKDIEGGPLDLFAQVPVLQHFEIAGNGKAKPVIPWSQLTHYAGRIVDAKTQVELLHQMPSLTHASFRLGHANKGTPSLSHCTHENLQSLSIKGNPFVLDNLTLPALRTLSVTSVLLLNPVVTLIQRSSCTLTSIRLDICGPEVEEADMIAIFDATPALASLSLAGYTHPMKENLISHLTFNQFDPEPCLLPKLRDFELWPERMVPPFPTNRIHSVFLCVFHQHAGTKLQ